MLGMAVIERPFRWGIGLAAAAVVMIAATAPVRAESAPSDENGRYTLSASGNGYLRLDTRTGAITICTSKAGWVCRVVPDERVALDEEIGRLQAEIDALKAQLVHSDAAVKGKIDEALPKGDSLKRDDAEAPAPQDKSTPPLEQRTPAHANVAAAFDWAWQRLVRLAARLHDKLSERI